MSIVITFEATAKVGEEKELLAFLVDTLADTRKFEGCIKVDAHTEEQSPGTLLLVEKWTTKEAYDAYLAWRGERGDMAKLIQYLQSEPVIRFFNVAG